MKKKSPLLLIVSSPSGAGKTTLCHMLLDEFSDLRFSISHTTRERRFGEVEGKDYFFVTDREFDQMIEDELFIEWAHVHGNRYGTARAEVRAAATEKMDLIFDVDYQGAKQIKEQYPGSVGVFVLPPTIEELQRRLRMRGTESAESLERRFKAALEEIANHELFDYLLVNDNLDVAYDSLRAILISERMRHSRVDYLAREMLEV
ncbi:MAG: guanylate kinase [Deltaproteobacteria bacterium]|nr:guanylate kinase [Deltaproteobacteria bacterium]